MSNIQMIRLLSLLLILSVFLGSVFLYILKKIISEKQQYSIFENGKVYKEKRFLDQAYDFFSQWSVTRAYIKKITRKFEIHMPGDTKMIFESTIKTAFKIWGMDIVVLLILFVRAPTFYTAVLFVLYLYIINDQIIYRTVENNEITLLKQFGILLGDVRHNYQVHKMADTALYDSLEKSPYLIRLHGLKIFKILEAEDREEEISKYNETVPNCFLKTFLSICVMIMKYGDKQVDNQSLYLLNLKYLKQEVNMELLKREKIKHLFSGLILVIVTPVLFLKMIENWSVNSLPEMEAYYKGTFGILTMFFIFLATLCSYILISHMKENNEIERKEHIILKYISSILFICKLLDNITDKNYGKTLRIRNLLKAAGESITTKQFLLQRIICCASAFFSCILLSLFIHSSNKNQILTNYNNLNYLNSAISERQVRDMQKSVSYYVNKYKNSDIDIKTIKSELEEEGIIKVKQLMTMTLAEIVQRIHAYRQEYYKWYELMAGFGAAMMAYYIPYLNLLFIKKMRQMNMEDEVIQYHSIILMLMHIDRMTIETVLTSLENFSVIFRQSIQECINDLQSGDLEALEELKLKEPFEPFVKIIENLQISDKIGIRKAFDEIAAERSSFQEKRKLENEITINNKSILGQFIAFIPLTITVGLYLIIPFLVEGLSQFAKYLEQMKHIT